MFIVVTDELMSVSEMKLSCWLLFWQNKGQFFSEKSQTIWRLRPAGGPVQVSQLDLHGPSNLVVPFQYSRGWRYWFGEAESAIGQTRVPTRFASGITGALWVTQSNHMTVVILCWRDKCSGVVERWSLRRGSVTGCVVVAGSVKLSVQTKTKLHKTTTAQFIDSSQSRNTKLIKY